MSDDIELKKRSIKEEIEQLKYEFKVELPKKIAEARSYGDLKENAEYHAAKERQSFLSARITQLSSQLSQLSNLSVSDIARDRIGFGSTVTVLDLESEELIQFTFVSPNEVKPAEGRISLSSPVGMALQNRGVGEEVDVLIPAGKKRYRVERFTTLHGDSFES
ncbi:MAG TPA: transcription elongation factor GreA [Spirochaetota bacterium]|nr:transcription elongation factor GreA [Spirochaetota bacterium]HNU91358.1 transcription elongation factor GreA [Spirochaetota bacterium]HPI13692.1 transcription elongation factor GreA [Spirochaetota bacterium]HPV97789.1 transcription elongation factor GreA [Spirochaetota bacterium]